MIANAVFLIANEVVLEIVKVKKLFSDSILLRIGQSKWQDNTIKKITEKL